MPFLTESIPTIRAKDGKTMAQVQMPVINGISESELWQLWQAIGHFSQERPFVIKPDYIIGRRNYRSLKFTIFKRLPSQTIHTTQNTRYRFAMDHQFELPILHQLLPPQIDQWIYQDGMLFMLIRRPQYGMMVLDVRDPDNIKQVGYYYAPGEELHRICSLADGRVALIGTKLHLFDTKNW